MYYTFDGSKYINQEIYRFLDDLNTIEYSWHPWLEKTLQIFYTRVQIDAALKMIIVQNKTKFILLQFIHFNEK